MHSPQRSGPYLPRSRQEWHLVNQIDLTRRLGRYGLGALWGGIGLGIAGVGLGLAGVGLGLSTPLQLAALIAIVAAVVVEVGGVGLSITNFFLHLRVSLQAVQIQRTAPHNPLPAKYLHAELVRWIKRIDLLLTTIATLVATLATLGIGIAVTVPTGIGLGFIGWVATELWGLGANRVVYREVRRQKEGVRLLVESRSHPKSR
ncbi:MAG: hypothetical protein ACLQUY_16600 [Ktedonobacterales bacterium]